MKKLKAILYWLPRLLSVAFVLFLSLFALDVFDGNTGWNLVAALFMHLLPSLILLVVIMIAWKYDLVGAAVFLIFAGWYVWTVGFDRHWSWYASISGPAALVGILFLISWWQKKNQAKINR